MKPRGSCPQDGKKHALDKRIKMIGLQRPDGKIESVADLPDEKYWYCTKCKSSWRR